jgi:septum formation protein
MSQPVQIYLASRSPRRQELLIQIGVSFELVDADVPEVPAACESPRQFVCRVAGEKARAGLARLRALERPERPVLAADTCVVLDEHILGKPGNRDEAVAMLGKLAGRSHQVLTAVHVCHGDADYPVLSRSRVWFADLTPRQIERYWDSGEPHDKAGAYGIQGRAAAFVSRLEGSYSGVVGLPLYEVAQLLRQIGIQVL